MRKRQNNGEIAEGFSGWWIPADIVKLFQDGTISASELILLATIDSLVDRGRGRGVGCYASNAWLAARIHCSNPKSVSNMIRKLKELKLIRQVKYDGRTRYLETRWSRVRHAARHP